MIKLKKKKNQNCIAHVVNSETEFFLVIIVSEGNNEQLIFLSRQTFVFIKIELFRTIEIYDSLIN